MTTLLGLAILYAWIHAGIIIGKKVQATTQYETAVLIFALVGFILYVIGTMK